TGPSEVGAPGRRHPPVAGTARAPERGASAGWARRAPRPPATRTRPGRSTALGSPPRPRAHAGRALRRWARSGSSPPTERSPAVLTDAGAGAYILPSTLEHTFDSVTGAIGTEPARDQR